MTCNQNFANSIYEWLRTTECPTPQDNRCSPSEVIDATFSQPTKKPHDGLEPMIAQKLTPSFDFQGLNDRPQVLSEVADHYEQIDGTSETIEYNPYARRPRNKTKEDKYVFQERPKHKTNHKSTRRKAKRKESSATALLHRFSAKNVEPERLTASFILPKLVIFLIRELKSSNRLRCRTSSSCRPFTDDPQLRQSIKPGLFGKGRISSPFYQKPLLDIAFSNVQFSHPQESDGSIRIPQYTRDKCRKETEPKDDEISRFFRCPKAGKSVNSTQSFAENKFGNAEAIRPSRRKHNALVTQQFLGLDEQPSQLCFSFVQEGEPVHTLSNDSVASLQLQGQNTWLPSPTTTRTKRKRADPTSNQYRLDSNITLSPADNHTDIKSITRGKSLTNTAAPANCLPTPFEPTTTLMNQLSDFIEKWKRSEKGKAMESDPNQASEVLDAGNSKEEGEKLSKSNREPSARDAAPLLESERAVEKTKPSKQTGDVTQDSGLSSSQLDITITGDSSLPYQKPSNIASTKSLRHRGQSSRDMVGPAWQAPQSRGSITLSLPMTSVYENQLKYLTAVDLPSQRSLDITERSSFSRSSFLSSLRTDPTSLHSVQHTMAPSADTTLDYWGLHSVPPNGRNFATMYPQEGCNLEAEHAIDGQESWTISTPRGTNGYPRNPQFTVGPGIAQEARSDNTLLRGQIGRLDAFRSSSSRGVLRFPDDSSDLGMDNIPLHYHEKDCKSQSSQFHNVSTPQDLPHNFWTPQKLS